MKKAILLIILLWLISNPFPLNTTMILPTNCQEILEQQDDTLAALLEMQAVNARNEKLLEAIFQHPMSNYLLASLPVTVTAYTASVDETDDTPHLTADHSLSRIGLLAVSRDLLGTVSYGQRVLLDDYGLFVVADTMNPRFTSRVDILMGNKRAALQFGKRTATLRFVIPQ